MQQSKSRIDQIVSDGGSRIKEGLEVAQKCNNSFNEIVKQSGDVGAMTAEISTAIREQGQGIGEISRAVGMLNEATQKNSVTSQRTATISQDLMQSSGVLGNSVEALARLIGHSMDQDMVAPEADAEPETVSHEPEVSNVISIDSRASQKPFTRAKSEHHALDVPSVKTVNGSSVPLADDPRFEDV